MGAESVEFLIESLLALNKSNKSISLSILQHSSSEKKVLRQDIVDEFFKVYASNTTKLSVNQQLDLNVT